MMQVTNSFFVLSCLVSSKRGDFEYEMRMRMRKNRRSDDISGVRKVERRIRKEKDDSALILIKAY